MKDLSKYLIGETNTIKEAVSMIQGNLTRCVLVANRANKIVGVFSEGDVLRAILQNTDLYTPLCNVISPSFKYLNTYDLRAAYELFRSRGITIIPVVDKSFRLKRVITIFDILEKVEFANGT